MAKDSTTGFDLARQLVREFPDAPSMTLARRLYSENKERFSTLNAARSAVRVARGNFGELKRKEAPPGDLARPNGKAGWKPECPPTQAEPWLPFVLETPCRVLSLSDAHVPYHDPRAIEAAVEFARKKFKPDVVLINGDWCDFYSVSRWDKDPKQRDFIGELGVCEDSLRWLRGRFPKARMILKYGNHEERYTKFIWNKAPELWGLDACRIENIMHLSDMGIEVVDDQRPVMAGQLPILHGHELGNFTNSVNHARGSFLRTLHAVLVGHGHRSSSHCEPDMFKSETATWSQGCLCDMSPDYARFNKWNLGFATIEVDKGGVFNVRNYRMSSDYEVRTS
jgi:predicted phosphodiesterase